MSDKPVFLVDAHCHLQDGFLRHNIEGALQRAQDAGVGMLCCNATSEEDWEFVLDLGKKYAQIHVALGLHPWFVQNRSADWLTKLRNLLATHPVSIGEIGLDNALKKRNDAEQETVFLAQMRLAAELERPVSIHCRKAFGRLQQLLANLPHKPPKMLLHAYAGSHEMVPVFEKLGCSLSFAGSITRETNKKARKACTRVQSARLLIETDSPAIAPVGVPFEQNEPAHLPRILQTLAALRGKDAPVLGQQTAKNAHDFFLLKKP